MCVYVIIDRRRVQENQTQRVGRKGQNRCQLVAWKERKMGTCRKLTVVQAADNELARIIGRGGDKVDAAGQVHFENLDSN